MWKAELKSVNILYQAETENNCLNKSQTVQTSTIGNFDYIKIKHFCCSKNTRIKQNTSYILGEDVYNP